MPMYYSIDKYFMKTMAFTVRIKAIDFQKKNIIEESVKNVEN